MTFYLADVFGTNNYTGNQLAVFFDFGELSALEMQKIAREINFSETTFVTSRETMNNGYPVRIFTPGQEIEFAGHPVLGTAAIISRYLEDGNSPVVRLNLKAGQIPVTFADGILWMRHNQPYFGRIMDPGEVSGMLGLEPDQIDDRFPIQEVTTGLPFTIIPLKTLDDLKRASVQLKTYNDFISKTWAKGIQIFSQQAYEEHHHLSCRVFVNYLGIPEDPATGSAAGCLAAYLVNHMMFGSGQIEKTIGQGYEIGRPSEIRIKAQVTGNEYEVYVGGKVFEIAKGEWKVKG